MRYKEPKDLLIVDKKGNHVIRFQGVCECEAYFDSKKDKLPYTIDISFEIGSRTHWIYFEELKRNGLRLKLDDN